jgi:hypothetical protein
MKDDHTMKKNHNTQKERRKRMHAGEEREEKLSMLQQTRE